MRLLIILYVLLHSFPLYAQSTLTIEQASDEALGRSPGIAQAKSVETEASWRSKEVRGEGFVPKVSVNAHHYLTDKFTETSLSFGGGPVTKFKGFYPRDEASLDLKIPIFDGFNNLRSLEAADLGAEAAGAERNYAEFSLKQDVRLAFYRALAAAQLQAVAEENVRTLEDHLKQAEIRKRGGVATNYDVLRVQVQLSEANTDLIDARDNVVITRKKLTQLLGRDDDERVLQGKLPVPAKAQQVAGLKWQADAIQNRKDIRAMTLRAQSAGKHDEALSAWIIPTVALEGEYLWYNQQYVGDSVKDTGHFQNAYNLAVTLNWNLYDGGVSQARQREALEQKTQSELAAQSALIKSPYDFDYWQRKYLSNVSKYNAKLLDIQRSEESVRLSKKEEKAGTRTATETLDAELDLFRSRAGQVNALLAALEAEVELEKTLGREI